MVKFWQFSYEILHFQIFDPLKWTLIYQIQKNSNLSLFSSVNRLFFFLSTQHTLTNTRNSIDISLKPLVFHPYPWLLRDKFSLTCLPVPNSVGNTPLLDDPVANVTFRMKKRFPLAAPIQLRMHRFMSLLKQLDASHMMFVETGTPK